MWRTYVVAVLAVALGAVGAVHVAGRYRTPNVPAEPGWTKLPNGLRVAIRPIEGAKDVAVLTVFDIGSDHDPEGRSGLAHLTEHLFVTSAAGATPARAAEDWVKKYERRCAAFTEQRATTYLTTVPAAALETELTDLAARMSDLRIEASDLDRERASVLQQIAETHVHDADPNFACAHAALQRIRPRLDPDNRGGVPADVESLSLDDVRARAQRYYRPADARLILTGAIEHVAALDLVKRHFADLPGGLRATRATLSGRPAPGRLEIDCGGAGSGGTLERSVCIAYPAPFRDDPDFLAMILLEKRALPDAPKPFLHVDLDADGVAALRWSNDDLPVNDIVRAADGLIARFAEHPPTQEEIEFVERLGRWREPPVVLPEFPEMLAGYIAKSVTLGLDPDRVRTYFAAMTKDDLARLAAKWLAPENRVVVVARGVVPRREKTPESPYATAVEKALRERQSRDASTPLPSLDLISEVRITMIWDAGTETLHRKIGDVEYPEDTALQKAIGDAHDVWVKKGKPDAPVTIDASPDIPWDRVITVVNIVKRCGIDKIEFAMGAPPKTKPPKTK